MIANDKILGSLVLAHDNFFLFYSFVSIKSWWFLQSTCVVLSPKDLALSQLATFSGPQNVDNIVFVVIYLNTIMCHFISNLTHTHHPCFVNVKGDTYMCFFLFVAVSF